MKIKTPQWEIIDSNLERIEVPGGWLYRTDINGYGTALTFVPREKL